MAITEYTDEINDVTQTASEASIVINSNNKIIGSIAKGEEINTFTKEKLLVGTPEEIDTYILTNNLTYETFE